MSNISLFFFHIRLALETCVPDKKSSDLCEITPWKCWIVVFQRPHKQQKLLFALDRSLELEGKTLLLKIPHFSHKIGESNCN